MAASAYLDQQLDRPSLNPPSSPHISRRPLENPEEVAVFDPSELAKGADDKDFYTGLGALWVRSLVEHTPVEGWSVTKHGFAVLELVRKRAATFDLEV